MGDARELVTKLNDARDQLTGPGAPFEIEKRQINGIELRTYKAAPVTLRDALAQGRSHGQKTFLTFGEERYSFDAFFSAVDRVAHYMVNHFEIAKGDRVAIAMRNYPEWMMAYVAIVSIGAVVVPLNSWGQADELEYTVSDAGAKLLFCDQQRANFIESRLEALNCKAVVAKGDGSSDNPLIEPWEATQAGPAEMPDADIGSGDLVMILYTSGTTGKPKGAASTNFNTCQTLFNFEVHSYISAMANPETIEKMMASGFEPSTLLTVPLFHVSGCYAVFMLNLRGGRKTSILYKWDPEEALKVIERERITIFTGVPTMTMALLESPEFPATDTSSLFSIGAGGTACPSHLKDMIYEKIPHAYAGTGYGMTETNATCASGTGAAFKLHPNSAGTLSPIVECKTVDENGNDLAEGETGELYVKSPTNVQQYWNLPEASAETFIDGWVATGDIGYVDSDGFLFVVDRLKDLVIRGGENISPLEIETILLSHPQVQEAAVYGIPHDQLGEELAATVFVAGNPSQQELTTFVADKLAKFKVPSIITLSKEALPKNATGKLLKKTIREEYLSTLNG
ncbi:MAG: class I adenylate-forming enzyme family protein [Halioglobus sp.]